MKVIYWMIKCEIQNFDWLHADILVFYQATFLYAKFIEDFEFLNNSLLEKR